MIVFTSILTFIIKNRTLVLIGLLLLAIAYGVLMTNRVAVVKDERDRVTRNSRVEIKRFKDKSGADAITIQEQQITVKELRNTNDSAELELYKQAKILGNKDREIEYLTSVQSSVIIKEVKIPIYDTTIVFKGIPTIVKMSKLKTKWIDLSVIVRSDTLEILECIIPVELIIVGHWYKERKFFIARWFEKKKWGIDVKSTNPYVKINNAENIRITGKRGR